MNLLAIDCSTEYLSLALQAGEALYCFHQHAGQRHAETMLGEISRLLERGGLRMDELNGIAYGRGPGSFTGLRIACGVTQGLAYALGIRVKGIVTLEALAEEAYAACGAEHVIACTDARMGEVYHAAYRRLGKEKHDGWTPVCAPGVYKPGDIPGIPFVEHAGPWTGCGNGFAVHGDALLKRYPDLQAVRPDLMPSARAELVLAQAAFLKDGGDPPDQALPLYIRDNVALKKSER